MSSRKRYKKSNGCTFAIETSAKCVANRKELSSFILDILKISRQPKRIRKNQNYQKFLLMLRYLSEVNLNFSYFPFKVCVFLENDKRIRAKFFSVFKGVLNRNF